MRARGASQLPGLGRAAVRGSSSSSTSSSSATARAATAGAADEDAPPPVLSTPPHARPGLDALLNGLVRQYWRRTPSAGRLLRAVEARRPSEGPPPVFDHMALRTFGADGCGIASVARDLEALGYERRDSLVFPSKKLNAVWFAPPADGLPRMFVSELEVGKFAAPVQAIIRKYTGQGAGGPLEGRGRPWEAPTKADYDHLAEVSEYAAWTLAHGYLANHLTVAVHRLDRETWPDGIVSFVEWVRAEGFELNAAGIQTSPDGLLLQASTVADTVPYEFAGGETARIPCAFVEVAERKVLPEYEGVVLAADLTEAHLRDGFEAGNADKIFESTNAVK